MGLYSLYKRIIREAALMGGERRATRQELSARLGVSPTSVSGAVRMLLGKGLLKSVTEPSVDGKRSPDSLIFGDGALLVLIERVAGGFSVSLRGLDGELLQRKFIAEDISMSVEDRVLAAASAVLSYCGVFAESRDRFALGVVGADASERKIWRRVGADLVFSGDVLNLANKQFGGTDILVNAVSGEILVMRGGVIINPRTEGRSVFAVKAASRVVDLAMLLDADNIVLLNESEADGLCEKSAIELRLVCSELGARARVLVDGNEARYQLICEMLRDKVCERIFNKNKA